MLARISLGFIMSMLSMNILIKGIQWEKRLMLLIDYNRVETIGFPIASRSV